MTSTTLIDNNGPSSMVSADTGSAADNTGLLPTKTVTLIENSTIINQRPAVFQDVRANQSLIGPSISSLISMGDQDWDMVKIFSKPVVIDRFTWTAAQAQHTSLRAIRVPEFLNSLVNLQNTSLSFFAYYRPDFEIEISCNGNRFFSGRAVVAFNSLSEYAFDALPAFAAANMNSVFLDASQATCATFRIPFSTIQSYFSTLNTGDFDHLGTLVFYVFNQLQAPGQQQTSIPIVVKARAVQAALHTPIYPHTPVLFSLSTSHVESTEIQSGLVELCNAGVDIGKKVFGIVGSLTNQDRPVVTQQAVSNRIETVSNMAHGVGVDGSNVLALTPGVTTTHHEAYLGSAPSEMSLDLLLQRKGFVDTVQWDTTQTTGFNLLSVPVSPNLSPFTVNPTFNNAVLCVPPWLTYAAAPFKVWRGGITYRVELAASGFHSGRLLMAFFPASFLNSETALPAEVTLENAFSCPNVEFDLEESKEFSWTVPFQSVTPWKHVSNYWGYAVDSPEESTGILAIFVLNALRANSTVSAGIALNLFYQGAPDFKVAFPSPPAPYRADDNGVTTQNAYSDLVQVVFTSQTEQQGDTVQQSSQDDATPGENLAVDVPLTLNVDSLTFGESFELKDLLRRYTFAIPIPARNGGGGQLTVVQFKINPFSVMDPADQPGWIYSYKSGDLLSWFSDLYAMWRGSLRYKFISDSDMTDDTQVHVSQVFPRFDYPNANRATSFTVAANEIPANSANLFHSSSKNLALIETTNSRQSSIEVQTQFATHYTNLIVTHIRPSNRQISFSDPFPDKRYYSGYLNLRYANARGQGTGNSYLMYKAAGDDFLLHGLLAPPIVPTNRVRL